MADAHPRSNPGVRSAAVTPHDVTELSEPCRALYVGTFGDVRGKLVGDAAAVYFKNVPAGSTLPYAFKLVMSTGTTASDIVAIY